MKKKLIFLIFFLVTPLLNVFAETQNFRWSDKALKIQIAKEYNRLRFDNANLVEIVGDVTQFAILSTVNQDVVLQSNLDAGKPLKISVVANNGLTQDLILCVNSRLKPQNIVIDMANFFEKSVSEKKITSLQESVKTFIHSIAEKEELAQKFLNKQRIFELDVAFGKLHKVFLPNGIQILGQIIKVTNNQRQTVNLRESNWFKSQKNLQAFVFQQNTLGYKETSYAILVTAKN